MKGLPSPCIPRAQGPADRPLADGRGLSCRSEAAGRPVQQEFAHAGDYL